jgi:hypothetical protein
MVQCQMPDTLFKTCLSLSKVRQVGQGSYLFETEILVDPDQAVVASFRNSATVSDNSVCDVMRLTEIEHWTFTVGGSHASPAQAVKYRASMKRDYARFSGQTICTRIMPSEGGMEMVLATIGGKRFPAADYSMKWVGPKDGWRVAP